MTRRVVVLGAVFGLATLSTADTLPGSARQAAALISTIHLSAELPSTGRLGGVSVDADGMIYVSNFREAVWRITPDGEVTPLATDLRGSSGNAIAPDGSLLQASFVDNRIVRIGRDGTVSEFANGFDGPVGIATDQAGNTWVCNCRGNSISRVAPDGKVSVFARSDLLDCPNGITVGPDGALIVASFNNSVLARITPDGAVHPWVEVGQGGNAHLARVNDDIYVTRIAANTIHRVTRDGTVSIFAGTGEPGLRDGPALQATLARPNGIAATADGGALIINNLDGEWRADAPSRIVLRRIDPLPSRDSLEHITIRVDDFIFDAIAAGPVDGELVLLLHGFPQTGYAFRHQIAALAAAGYRAVAPDQRGYSPGARPVGVENYAMAHLVDDVIGMVDALGRSRFHLVGHDWGGAVAWVVATRHADRVRTLTVLATPHYAALSAGIAEAGSEQAQRSSYFEDFASAGAEQRLLENDMARFRSIFDGLDIPPRDLDVYLDRLGTPDAMRAALDWYGALVAARRTTAQPPASVGQPPTVYPVRVPTLYVWGSGDAAFARSSAEATASFVTGPFRFVALEGASHWLPEAAADTVTTLLLDHVRGR